MNLLLLSWIAPLWTGDRLAGAVLGRPRGLAAWLRHASLAVLLGLAAVAALRFVVVVLSGSGFELGVVAEIGLLALVTMLSQRPGVPGPPLPWAPVALLLAIPALWIGLQLARNPWGDADAISIWNLRAIFLHRAAGDWHSVFPGTLLPHVDYPLLLPLLVARGFAWAGAETPAASAGLALAFGLAPVALLCGTLAMRSGVGAALVAAAVLALTPLHAAIAAARVADVPLAGYVLATLVLLAERRPSAIWLAGFAAGAASFTKNEGLLWLLCCAGLSGLLVLARRRPARELVWLLAGMLVVGGVTLWFKIAFAPAQDLLAAQVDGGTWARVTSPERWGRVAVALGAELVWFGGAQPQVPGLAVLPLLAWALRSRESVSPPWSGIALVHLMWVGFFAAFLLTPYDLEWHLPTAAPRLLLQLWPAALFLAGISLQQEQG